MRFVNKVVVVTGSSRGIGMAIALGFAREGADVVVNYSASKEAAENVVKQIESMGRRSIAVKANVASSVEASTLIDKTIETFGKVDVLVNNAGVAKPALMYKMSDEEWLKVINVDLTGIFNCIRAVAPHMVKRRYGKIVNISSTAAYLGFTGNVNYAAAKAGCNAITKTAAKELGRYGINVNAVAPAIVETEMSREVVENPALKEKYLKWTVLGRFAKPEDIVPAVLFLASDEASYITGHILVVDGGQTISIA